MTAPNRYTTQRGFEVFDDFADVDGCSVRVMESSAAMAPHCWIFVGVASEATGAHLDVEQAQRVRDALDAFIQYGS